MSVGFYYLLLEHRNAAALDPDAVLREHQSCQVVEANLLEFLAECVALATPVAYAPSAAEAQRQLRLLGNWELVLREPQAQGFGRQPREVGGTKPFWLNGSCRAREDHGYRPVEPRCQGGTPCMHACGRADWL